MRISRHIEPLVGRLLAARFGPRQVRLYIAERQKHVENATINRELAILRRGIALGMREDPPLVRNAPHFPKLEESEPRRGFIEQGQYEILLATLPERFKALFVLGYHFGCRLGELRKLRWDQVDFDAGKITLEREQTKAKEGRVLPFYGDVREWLERQREYCHGTRVFCYRKCEAEKTWRGTKPVEHPFGKNMEGWHEACEAAGLPGLLFHDLRRSAVRNMVRAGIPESVARKISGHKTQSVFQRYNIVADSDLDDAAEKMNAFAQAQKTKTKLRRVK
jgi:integrase